jgi:hypothetical protein
MIDDECGHGSLPHRLVHLVLPEGVVAARTLEQGRILVGRRAREGKHDPAAHVGVVVIVPLLFGRHDAVSHEHRLTACAGRRVAPRHVGDEIGHRLERVRSHLERRPRRAPPERNALIVGAVVTRRLKAQPRELRGEILGRDLSAALAGAASLQDIIREESEVRADHLRLDRPRQRRGGGLGGERGAAG